MEALKNGMKLSSIYQDGVLRWEKPYAECQVDRLTAGLEIIEGLAFPRGSIVKVQISRNNEKIFENSVQDAFFNFSMAIPMLEKSDVVVITVSSPGYKTYRTRQRVRQ